MQLSKDMMALAKQAAKIKVHTLPEPKPPSKKDMQAMSMPMDSRPSLYLDDKEAPFIKDWETGKEYTMVLRVKMTGSSTRTHMEDGKSHERMSADLEICEIAALPAKK